MNYTSKIFVGILFFLSVFWPSQVVAQSYVQVRLASIYERYKPLNPEILNRDEHDFEDGSMVDIELGKSYGTGRFAFLLGGRLQYLQSNLKGT